MVLNKSNTVNFVVTFDVRHNFRLIRRQFLPLL